MCGRKSYGPYLMKGVIPDTRSLFNRRLEFVVSQLLQTMHLSLKNVRKNCEEGKICNDTKWR